MNKDGSNLRPLKDVAAYNDLIDPTTDFRRDLGQVPLYLGFLGVLAKAGYSSCTIYIISWPEFRNLHVDDGRSQG